MYRCKLKKHSLGKDEPDRNRARSTFDGQADNDYDDDEEVAVKVLDKSTIISQSMTKQVSCGDFSLFNIVNLKGTFDVDLSLDISLTFKIIANIFL